MQTRLRARAGNSLRVRLARLKSCAIVRAVLSRKGYFPQQLERHYERQSNSASLAQLVEQVTLNHRVEGSSPSGRIIKKTYSRARAAGKTPAFNALPPRHAFDLADEFHNIDGFREEILKAGLQRLFAVFLAGVGGEGQRGEFLRAGWQFSNFADQ